MMVGDVNNNHAIKEKAQLEDHPYLKPPNTKVTQMQQKLRTVNMNSK